MVNLEKKIALITGSSRGIGRGCAIELAKCGADVIINYYRHGDEAEEVAEIVRGLGRSAIVIGADVSDVNAVEEMINEALGNYNKIIPRAKGEGEQTVQQAEGYATDRVNRAKGDVSLFNDLLAAYKRAPEVTRRRMYLETMADVYPNVKQKIILDKDLEGILPLLPLGKAGK